MKQYEAVIKIMEGNGGYATLRFLNQNVLKVEGVKWKTKTPFASIRRIVQDDRFFFKIRPGLWALKSFKDNLPPDIFPTEDQPKQRYEEYSHTFYQGLLIEIGNFNGFQTFIPNQDKNKNYLGKKLSEIATISEIYEFSYPSIVAITKNIDVIWFNERNMPSNIFEIEHTTAIHNSLIKFVELQDFYARYYIVADEVRRKEFQSKLALKAFYPIAKRVWFWSYDDVAELHARTDELMSIKSKIGNNF
jgi:hypothetical protein